MSDDGTGVVDPPSGGFEIGQDIINSAAAGLDAFIDIVASFFHIYLLTSTMFLLTVSVFFAVIYFIGQWPSQYGTQMQLRRTKRSFTGLLLLCGLFPLLYVAGWIGSGSTSHSGLPEDGMFGTGFEQRIIGVSVGSDGLGMFVDVVTALFRMYLATVTSVMVILVVLFASVRVMAKLQAYGNQMVQQRAYRSVAGLLLSIAILPILYAAGWIGTSSTTHDGLPEDGIFGTTIEERIIGPTINSDGLQMFVDVGVSIFRMYFATLTTFFIFLSVMYLAAQLVGWAQSYGREERQERSFRSLRGLFMVTVLLPILYTPVWIAEGTQSPSGYNLPSDGVFGTNIEDRIFGPNIGEGGFGELVSILASVVHTYQVTISFFLIVCLIVLAIGYALVQWPNELKNRNFRARLQRVGLGLLASLSFIPVLYAVGWVATGFYTPDESMTWVAPRISLPYEELFQGPDYHPFIQDLSASSDPLGVVFRNIFDFQTLTLVYLGVAAIVTGLLVYTVFNHSNYIQTSFGKQSIRGGVLVILAAFILPFVLTGAAWVATGVPGDGYIGDGPPGFSSDCTSFEASMGGWETVEGSQSPVTEPYGIELDGTISQEFQEVGMGDRSVTIRPITSDKNFQIRMYSGGEKVLDETTQHSASYIVGTNDDIRVEVESDGGQINELCVGFEPVSDPQLDIAVDGVGEEKPLILRRGITMKYTVYNVGEVHTGSEFDVHLVLNGTDPWGDASSADSETTLPPMAGGEFTDETNRFDDLRGTPPVDRVKMIGYVDPYDELDERTTVPNIDETYINVVYANMYGHIDATAVNNNATDIQTRVVNNGTIYSDPTTANVTIYDEDNGGERIRSWTVSVANLTAGEEQTNSLNHTFRSPGNYTAEINVDEFLFPRGSIEQDSLQFIAPDLHATVVGVEDRTRVDTPTEFTVSVQNKGNDRFDEQTNATVQLTNPDGTVTEERVLTVPSLDEGEYYNQTIQMTPQSGGTHTVGVHVDDSLYPYGNNDSEEILSVGPSFTGSVSSSDLFQTEQTDVTASVTNNGDRESRASQMHISLIAPNGTEIRNNTYEVPELDSGETRTVDTPFRATLESPGKYDVEMDVDPTLSTTGAFDTSSFEVYSFNLSVAADPVEGSNEVRFDVSLENLADSNTGTYKDVVVTARNSSDDTVSTGTITFPPLNGHEEQTRTTVLELNNGGTHTATAELQVGRHDSDSVRFNHSWPDLSSQINATQTSVSGDQSTVQTQVTNVGSNSSEATTAEVRVYDIESGRNRVYTTSVNVPTLAPGESHEENVTVEFPDQGVYEAEIDVTDADLPANNVDRTNEIEVFQSEINIQVNRERDNVPSGENGTVQVTVSNAGSDESGTIPVQTEFTDPDGQTVATIDDEVGPLAPGETVNLTHTTKLSSIGTHDVESTATSDISGTVRDSSSIEVVEPYIIDVTANRSQVPIGDEAQVEVSITNAGTEPREPNEVITQYVDPNGNTLVEYNESVAQLDPGEEHVFQFNATLQNPGDHEIIAETQVEGSTIVDSDQVEAIDTYLINVEPVESNIILGDTGEVKVTVENIGNEQTDPNEVNTTFVAPGGSTVGEFTENISTLDPGQQETFRVGTSLDDYGIHDITSEITVGGFQTEDSAEIEVGEPLVVSVDENQSKVDVGENGEVTVTVRNIGESTTEANTVETTFYNPVDESIGHYTRDVPSLASGEEVTFELSETLEQSGVHDIEAELTSDQYTVSETGHIEAVEPQLTMEVNAEQDPIGQSEDGVLLADISNIGTKESQQRMVTVEFEYENGTVVDQWETTVEPLGTGETTTLRLSSSQLDEVGEYTGTVQVEKKDSGWLTGSDTVEVSPSSLSVDVTANNVEEGSSPDITTSIENNGVSTSDSTTATVRIEQSGSMVAEETIDVRGLESGESQTNNPFQNIQIDPGSYDVFFNVDSDESGTQDQDQFAVGYWDLKGNLAVSDEERSNQHEITVEVPNEGTVSSDPTTATVNITGPSGDVVKQQQIDVPAISGGGTYTHDVSFQTDESGEHTANLDVSDPERPDGTTDQQTFVVSWGNLTSSISIADVVEDEEGNFQVTVVNEGPGESYATSGTVNIRDSFGNILEQYTVSVPALQSGESYETTVTHQFERPGTYEGEIDVDYSEYPQGTTDTTGEIDVVHGNLNGRLYFTYGSSDVGTETPFVVQITNNGNAVSESTTADVWIENRHGDTVYQTQVNVSELDPGDSDRKELSAVLNTSGTNTAHVEVNEPEFPIGNEGQGQIDVVSPDLRTSLSVEDTNIGEQTNVTITIVNDGEITSDSTTVEVRMFNDDDKQVVREEFGVQSLGPGESVTIDYDQLIAAECWRTEMTCEPGAKIDKGTYTATANASATYAEEGTVGEDTFVVEEKEQ
ncbi:CARDB domain-containing protein [Halosimplex pelagicum]|uniref:CARDB domain-containing protein n=1 Tax=Halosimplex pelagicum TaxID=869886 RepID=A0A7D5P726_9EURY|nr:CARDB domain-containing protein [Halosimplex pelagicum]QLH82386.1 hypothetical protein HZS54_12495 [Halosimplex pelagicum]